MARKTAKEKASEVVATQKMLIAAKSEELKANNVQLGIQGEASIAPGSTLPTAPPPTVTGYTNAVSSSGVGDTTFKIAGTGFDETAAPLTFLHI